MLIYPPTFSSSPYQESICRYLGDTETLQSALCCRIRYLNNKCHCYVKNASFLDCVKYATNWLCYIKRFQRLRLRLRKLLLRKINGVIEDDIRDCDSKIPDLTACLFLVYDLNAGKYSDNRTEINIMSRFDILNKIKKPSAACLLRLKMINFFILRSISRPILNSH